MNKLEIKLELSADGMFIPILCWPSSSGPGDAFFRDPGRPEGRSYLPRVLTRTVDPMFTEDSVAHSQD